MDDDGTGTPLRPVLAATAVSSVLTASPGSMSPVEGAAAGATETETKAAAATTTTTTATALTGDTAVPGICVFSGGTGANSLVDAFQAVAAHLAVGGGGGRAQPCPLTYIIPISDNGGSSSELIRFFGGPSVGDIRSRLVRLIPTGEDESGGGSGASGASGERAALRALFEHRLCAGDPRQARSEWLELVEARHLLWTFVPSAARELIRAVLNTLNLEIVKRARPSTSVFNFAGASVGNLFLTGARLLTGSFEAAIYLLRLLCGIPDHVAVLPAVHSNFTHHISAGLADGTVVAGQVNISHPSAPTWLPDGEGPGGGDQPVDGLPMTTTTTTTTTATATATTVTTTRARASTAVDFEDATLPGSLPALRRPQLAVDKAAEADLPARIARVWYINPYGHEIRPPANPKALAALRQARAVVYSVGSLYTSIVPSLVLRGVGAAVAGTAAAVPKVLILNSTIDRETGPRADPMTAADFVRALAGACKQSQADAGPVQDAECRRYVTHVVYIDLGMAPAAAEATAAAPASPPVVRPAVDETALRQMGVQCVAVPPQAGRPDRYDQAALTAVLKELLGTGRPA